MVIDSRKTPVNNGHDKIIRIYKDKYDFIHMERQSTSRQARKYVPSNPILCEVKDNLCCSFYSDDRFLI